MHLEKISLDVERKGTRDAIGMLRVISEGNLDIDEELCACFIDWQKAFDRLNWHCTQSRSSWFRFQMRLLNFFIDLNIPVELCLSSTR